MAKKHANEDALNQNEEVELTPDAMPTDQRSRRELEMEAISSVKSYGIARKKSPITIKNFLLTIVVLAVLAGAAYGGYQLLRSKYTDAIDEQMEILNARNENLESCLDASVGEMKKQFVMDYGGFIVETSGSSDKWNASLKKSFMDQYAVMEKNFGADFQVSYAIKEETQLKDQELSRYYEDIGDHLSNSILEIQDSEILQENEKEKLIKLFQDWRDKFREAEVTDGYSAIVELTYKSGGETKNVTTRMVVVLIGDEWIVRSGSLLAMDSERIFANMEY